MTEYIEREELLREVTEKYSDIVAGSYPYNIVAYDMANLIRNAPAADVVEVVRCGECVHDGFTSCPLCYIEQHTLQFVNHDSNFFCGKGERRCD